MKVLKTQNGVEFCVRNDTYIIRRKDTKATLFMSEDKEEANSFFKRIVERRVSA